MAEQHLFGQNMDQIPTSISLSNQEAGMTCEVWGTLEDKKPRFLHDCHAWEHADTHIERVHHFFAI